MPGSFLVACKNAFRRFFLKQRGKDEAVLAPFGGASEI